MVSRAPSVLLPQHLLAQHSRASNYYVGIAAARLTPQHKLRVSSHLALEEPEFISPFYRHFFRGKIVGNLVATWQSCLRSISHGDMIIIEL